MNMKIEYHKRRRRQNIYIAEASRNSTVATGSITDEGGKNCLVCSKESACESHQKRGNVSKGKTTFQSEICRKIFNRKECLRLHMAAHKGLKEFKCHICSKEYCRKINLSKHLKFHKRQREFKCNLCSKEFTNEGNLTRHLKSHTLLKEVKCNICSKKFFESYDWKQHLKRHTENKKFKCDHCSKVFYNKSHLNVRLKIHTEVKDLAQHLKPLIGLKFKCHKCGKEFLQSVELTLHLKTHLGLNEFKCHICSMDFNNKSNLFKHLSTHSDPDLDPLLLEDEIPPVVKDIVPDVTLSEESMVCHVQDALTSLTKRDHGLDEVKCHLCSKEFFDRCELTQHLKRHMENKKYNGHHCSEAFYCKSVLNVPLKTQSQVEVYICSKQSTQNLNLYPHLRENAEFKFKCHICSMEFLQNADLEAHLKTHSVSGECKCDLCCKEFKHISHLRPHCATHSTQETIKCHICCQHFKSTYAFLQHLKKLTQKFKCYQCGEEFCERLHFQHHMIKHNDQDNFVAIEDAVDMIAKDSDPDIDPLLIEEENPPVVKEESPDLTLSEKIKSEDFLGNECLVKLENNLVGQEFLKFKWDSGDIHDDFIKEEEYFDYDH